MAKRKRDIQLKVRVTPEERAMIEAKMAQLGTTNMGAYLRKMAIDGYVVKLDLPELRTGRWRWSCSFLAGTQFCVPASPA